jgi:hypothetical protein
MATSMYEPWEPTLDSRLPGSIGIGGAGSRSTVSDLSVTGPANVSVHSTYVDSNTVASSEWTIVTMDILHAQGKTTNVHTQNVYAANRDQILKCVLITADHEFRSDADIQKFHWAMDQLKKEFVDHIRPVVKELAVEFAREQLQWKSPQTNAPPMGMGDLKKDIVSSKVNWERPSFKTEIFGLKYRGGKMTERLREEVDRWMKTKKLRYSGKPGALRSSGPFKDGCFMQVALFQRNESVISPLTEAEERAHDGWAVVQNEPRMVKRTTIEYKRLLLGKGFERKLTGKRPHGSIVNEQDLPTEGALFEKMRNLAPELKRRLMMEWDTTTPESDGGGGHAISGIPSKDSLKGTAVSFDFV